MNPWTIAAIPVALSGKKKSPQSPNALKRAAAIRSVQSPVVVTPRDRPGSTNVLNRNPMSLFVRSVFVILLMFAFILAVIAYSYWVR